MDPRQDLLPRTGAPSPSAAVTVPGQPNDNEPEPTGGRAAERLREFLAKRLPPGASVEELNAEIAKGKKGNEEQSGSETDQDTSGPPDDNT
jgi:hypothetical protein